MPGSPSGHQGVLVLFTRPEGIGPRFIFLAKRVGQGIEASFARPTFRRAPPDRQRCKVGSINDAPLPSPLGGSVRFRPPERTSCKEMSFPAEAGLRVLLRRPLRPGDLESIFFGF
ncbi:hypothetical protein DV872_05880 [Oceanispirochaeta sp. M1]|nr:hypothetical protein DV872_05880 [Oceanispirochaeta sp. M1]